MKPIFFHMLKSVSLQFLLAVLVLSPINVMTQGRTVTRADIKSQGIPEGGVYLKIDELIVFEGTWQWVSAAGDSVFTLQLWREKFIPPVELTQAFSYDAIAGNYSLTVNGVIISHNTNKRTENNFPTFRGSDWDDDGLDKLKINFQDFVKNKWSRGRFELFRDNTNMARWSMWDEGFIILSPGEVFHRGFSLPNNVVLNRVQATPPPLP